MLRNIWRRMAKLDSADYGLIVCSVITLIYLAWAIDRALSIQIP